MPRYRVICQRCQKTKVWRPRDVFDPRCVHCLRGFCVRDETYVPPVVVRGLRRPRKPPRRTLTLCDALIVAASMVRTSEIRVPDLVVAAWQFDPRRFGLPGHEGQHSNSHAVVWLLCSKHGPVHGGHLERVRPNVVRLTAKGAARVEEIRTKLRASA